MADMPANSQTEATETAPKKKGKLIFVILILVVVLAAAGGGGYFFFVRSATAKSNAEKAKSEKGKKAKKGADEGAPAEAAEKPAEETEKTGADANQKLSTNKVLELSLPEDAEVKHVLELQPFIVNLADTDEARYLRMIISLGLGESETEKPDPIFVTRIRNAMLAVMATKSSQELLTLEGKTALRKELLHAAQAAVEEPRVEAIYITDFIVQL